MIIKNPVRLLRKLSLSALSLAMFASTVATPALAENWTLLNNNIYKNNSGNVGIGTTTPGSKLEVYDNTLGYDNIHGMFQNVSSLGRSQLIVSSGTYPNNFFSLMTHGSTFVYDWYLNDSTSDAGLGILLGQGSQMTKFAVGTYTATPLALFTNNTQRLNITSAGNVGIGTTTPGTKLDVSGTISASGITSSGTISLTGSTQVLFPGSGIWNSSGAVGIGTTNPGSLLKVAGTVNYPNNGLFVSTKVNATSVSQAIELAKINGSVDVGQYGIPSITGLKIYSPTKVGTTGFTVKNYGLWVIQSTDIASGNVAIKVDGNIEAEGSSGTLVIPNVTYVGWWYGIVTLPYRFTRPPRVVVTQQSQGSAGMTVSKTKVYAVTTTEFRIGAYVDNLGGETDLTINWIAM